MRYISKSPEPPDFSAWKIAHPDASYKDLSRAFTSATRIVKDNLRAALKAEQHALCCYCECRISDDDFHIEHFKPKDPNLFPALQLDYNNLHACCHANLTKTDVKTCGHKKDNFYSPDLVSPLEIDCADHFSFRADGSVIGTDDRGNLTISKLNLDSEQLRESRKNLLDFFLDDLTPDKLHEAVSDHLDPTKAEYGEYYSMIYQVFNLN